MSEFIKLTKDGAVIEVHPLSVPNHLELGWEVAEAEKLPAGEAKAELAEQMASGQPVNGKKRGK